MKFAFCLFKYFPYGGLQRDCIRIAKICQQKRHAIDIYTMQWKGEIPEGLNVIIVPTKGLTNHRRCVNFTQNLQTLLSSQNYDAVIGFNRMPDLDFYFASDVCFKGSAKQKHGRWFQLSSRYKTYAKLEYAVFKPTANTQIIALNQLQIEEYQKHYQTESNRFHILTPNIDKRFIPNFETKLYREKVLGNLNIPLNHKVLLFVGSDYHRKGLDRVIHSMTSLPHDVHLIVIGEDKPDKFKELGRRLNLDQKIHFLGSSDEVHHFMHAADLLVHPAYQEAGGIVLLEALVANLPVLTTENCGYAPYILDSQSGEIIPSHFLQEQLNQTLSNCLHATSQSKFRENAKKYCDSHDMHHGFENVVTLIEEHQAVVTSK